MILQGKVTLIDTDFVWADIPSLALGMQYPCRFITEAPLVGDDVLIVNIDGAKEDLVILGVIKTP